MPHIDEIAAKMKPVYPRLVMECERRGLRVPRIDMIHPEINDREESGQCVVCHGSAVWNGKHWQCLHCGRVADRADPPGT